MKPIKVLILSLVMAALVPICLPAQRIAGDDEYLHHSYQEAIRKYRAQVERHADDGQLLFNLANSYRLNAQLKEAERWFELALAHTDDSRAYLYYAQVLLSNRKYAQAQTAFKDYADRAPSDADAANARQLAAYCGELAQTGPQQSAVRVQKADFNSELLDFSPTYWREDRVVFASNRVTESKTSAADPWTETPFVDLWSVTIAPDGKCGTPVPFTDGLNTLFHDGPVAFANGGNRAYVTRSSLHGGGRRGYDQHNNTRLKIAVMDWAGNRWVDGKELPMNSDAFSTCHPALSGSGDTLVFASDRPGGYGGMDLWMCTREGASWSAPHNLGQEVNTAGNEVFPALHGDGSLTFSSDLLAGLGGLDLFSADLGREGWRHPHNLGAPLNSSMDDFGIVMSADKHHGHFTSNRSGSGDDIYSYLDTRDMELSVVVLDCKTHAPLPEVQVIVTGGASMALSTNGEGRVQVPVTTAEDYRIEAFASGKYGTADCGSKSSVHVPSKGDERLPEVVLYLASNDPCCFRFADINAVDKSLFQYRWQTGDGGTELGSSAFHCYAADGVYEASLEIVDADLPGGSTVKSRQTVVIRGCESQSPRPLVIEGTVRDLRLEIPLPGATVALLDKCSGRKLVATSDSLGRYQIVVPQAPDCDQWLLGDKADYAGQQLPLSMASAGNGNVIRQDLKLSQSPQGIAGAGAGMQVPAMMGQLPGLQGMGMVQLPALPSGYIYVLPINMAAMNRPGVMPSESDFSKPLASGDMIELYNIYFDFGRHDIRHDAVPDLEFLLFLLHKYPHMRGEISAHTDCRSSDAYNLRLSQLRAQAARNWLVERGVDPERLSCKGFGEYYLRNGCGDGVTCTEDEHQRNRRVEFRVTYFDGIVQSKEALQYVPRYMSTTFHEE